MNSIVENPDIGNNPEIVSKRSKNSKILSKTLNTDENGNTVVITEKQVNTTCKYTYTARPCKQCGKPKGKKNGWYGLSPSTPTILSCSWGVDGPSLVGVGFNNLTGLTQAGNFSSGIATNGPVGQPQGKNQPISALQHGINNGIISNADGYDNDNLLATSFNQGGVKIYPSFLTSIPNASSYNIANSGASSIANLPLDDATIDSYMRLLTDNGMHVVVAAGNSNLELNQKNPDLLPVLFFRNNTTGSPKKGQTHSVLRQMVLNSSTQKYTDNGFGLAVGQDYIIGTETFTLYASGNTYRNYQSPDVGVEFRDAENNVYNSREKFPLIKVGCVSALGDNDNAPSSYDSGGYTRSIYNLLYSERKPFLMKSNAPGTGGMIDAATVYIKLAGANSYFNNRIATRLSGHWNPFAYTPWTGTPQPAATLAAPDVGILYND
jgi:hypothetical protein